MPNTFISLCSTGEDAIEMQTSKMNSQLISGKRYMIQYNFVPDNRSIAPTFKQIADHFEVSVVKNSGKRLFFSDSSGTATFMIPGKAKELWVQLNDQLSGNYELVIVEASTTKKVTALSMLDDLTTKGSTILYVKFDDDKSIISSESLGLVDVIVDFLQTESDLNISIEAHTDNTGFEAEQLKVSESRALALYDAIVTKGVDKRRLKYKGWGKAKPVFDNSSEDGRAKNNRIELVKM